MNNFLSIENSANGNINNGSSEHMGLHEYDKSCGSEYLDQALRMTDQPLKEPRTTTLLTIDGLLWDL